MKDLRRKGRSIVYGGDDGREERERLYQGMVLKLELYNEKMKVVLEKAQE